MSLETLSAGQLRKAITIAEKIDKLENQLSDILGGSALPAAATATVPATSKQSTGKSKRTMSPEGRARIIAAQKERWSKQKSSKPVTALPSGKSGASTKATAKTTKSDSAPAKKGGLTEEGRARLAAAMKARWAKAKKSGAPAPTAGKKGRK